MPEWLGRQDRGAISLLRTASVEPASVVPGEHRAVNVGCTGAPLADRSRFEEAWSLSGYTGLPACKHPPTPAAALVSARARSSAGHNEPLHDAGGGTRTRTPPEGHPLLRRARLTRSATPAETSLRPTTCPAGAGSDRTAPARGTAAGGRTSTPRRRRIPCISRGTRSSSLRRRPTRRARTSRRAGRAAP